MEPDSPTDPRPTQWVKVTAVVPADLYVVWDTVCGMLENQGVTHRSEQVRNGMVLEVLAAEWIAGERR